MEALIETERLRLRALDNGDADRIAELVGDYEVAKMLAQAPYPYGREDALRFLARARDRAADGSALVCAIDHKGLIGVIGVSEIQTIEGERIGTLGYWMGRPYWGRGYATEAARALVGHAFGALGFAGLKSGHFKENGRSGRVLAKVGFRYAGEGPKHCLARSAEAPHIDVVLTRGQWQDFAARQAA
jgi:RimJ/RimL family protein N-acetyltransferase